MQKKVYSHIIWDWNGTLLDDVGWCIACINLMLEKRNKAILQDIPSYHNAFCFPVMEYYKNVGFDLDAEPFDALAREYIDLYHGAGSTAGIKLHKDAEHITETIYHSGRSQIILSASAQDNLLSQIMPFQIQGYFNEILGISDIYAKGKVARGLDYLSKNSIQAGLLIGDTIHDYEVALAMGVDCVLVAHGHQSKARLMECSVPVYTSLNEVLAHLF